MVDDRVSRLSSVMGIASPDFADSRGGWRIATTSHAYRFQNLEDRLVLSYYWHPTGLSPVAFPHLQIGGRTVSVDLSRAHLPTGPVTLSAVIRMVITELGVESL